MKASRTLWIALIIMAMGLPAFGQGFVATLKELTQVLTYECVGGLPDPDGNPLPDGYVVNVFWDRNGNGADPTDSLAPLCRCPKRCSSGPPNTVNLNSFAINGEYTGDGPGLFYMSDYSFVSGPFLPNPPRYFLRICIGDHYLQSNVIVLRSGPQEVEVASWTCIESPCPGCQPPPAPFNFVASDSIPCGAVVLSWDYPDTVSGVDSLFIIRNCDTTWIGVLGFNDPRFFVDSSVVAGNTYEYGIEARRVCSNPSDTLVSFREEAEGAAYAMPPTADSVSASDDSCYRVVTRFRYYDNTGVQRFVLFRGADSVGSIQVSGVPGARSINDPESTCVAMPYTVRGWSSQCGYGPASRADTGKAEIRPLPPATVVASDTLCDSIRVCWSNVECESGYRIRVNNLDVPGSPVSRDVTCLTYAPPQGETRYRITVIAFSRCGDAAAVADSGGGRSRPPQVANVQASDSAFCLYVHVTWQDGARETEYRAYRDGALIATVGADGTSYDDYGAAEGVVYLYTVAAYGACGEGTLSLANAGSRKSIPPRITTIAASENRCDGVQVTWNDVPREDTYTIYRDGDSIGFRPAGVTNFLDEGALSDVIYTFAVIAWNNCGADTTLPPLTDSGRRRYELPQVQGLQASDTSCTAVFLTWNNVVGEDSFRIVKDGSFFAYTTANDTDYTDTLATATHVYRVFAANAGCAGDTSIAEEGTRLAGQPAQVTGVQASDNGCDSIRVVWNQVAQVSGYFVYEGGVPVDTSFAGDDTTSVLHPAPGTYAYRVKAFNNCGNGALSDPDNGTRRAYLGQVQGVTASDTSCSAIHVYWDDLDDEDNYRVLRDGVFQNQTAANDTHYVDANAQRGVPYAYRIVAVNVCGAGDTSAASVGMRRPLPAQVQGVNASDNRCTDIRITWLNTPADSFQVRRNDFGRVGRTLANDTVFVDGSALPNTAYTYRVVAYNVCGAGDSSEADGGLRLQPPNPPQSVTASDSTCGQIRVSWRTGGGDLDEFRIYQDGTFLIARPASDTTYTVNITGRHRYCVAGFSIDCNQETAQVCDSGRGWPALAALARPVATDTICGRVDIRWNRNPEAVNYRLYRNSALRTTTTDTTYSDSNVDTLQFYMYTVAGVNPCGESAQSPADSGRSREHALFPALPDTVRCRDTLRVTLNHCPGAVRDSIFLRLGVTGRDSLIQVNSPVVDNIRLWIGDTGQQYINNCILKVTSCQVRCDQVKSETFVIYCPTDAADELTGAIPTDYFLDQNFPNPFNPRTTIRFGVPHTADVTIEVYDVTGRLVSAVAKGVVEAGVHAVMWDCSACPTGMYIIRLRAEDRVLLRKMLLMK